jgi:hypothetical protein
MTVWGVHTVELLDWATLAPSPGVLFSTSEDFDAAI